MKEVKTVGEYTIYQKTSGRHAVKGADKKYINGDDKAKILLDAGLIEIAQPKPAEQPSEEAAAEESTEAAAADDAAE